MRTTSFWKGSLKISIVFSIIFLSSCANSDTPLTGNTQLPSETSKQTLPVFPSATATVIPQSTSTELPPTDTTVPPTNTPTSTPVPQPDTYLLTTSDVPEFSQFYITIINKPDGFFTYWSMFIEENHTLMNRIEIRPEMPEPDSLTSNDPGLVEMEAPTIGDQSKVYADKPSPDQVTVVFYKNNQLVRILMTGKNTTIYRAVELGKIVAERLPDEPLSPLPITFPNQLKEETYTKYLGGIRLGQLDNTGKFEPVEFVNRKTSRIVVEITAIQALPGYQMAIYNPASNQYIVKEIFPPGTFYQAGTAFSFLHTWGGLSPGNYEFHFAIDETLVKVIPFEVSQ